MAGETTTEKGIWWLPEKPNEKLEGLISYGSGSGARLDLFGHFFEQDAPTEFTIHGYTYRGKPVSLFDCVANRVTMHLPGGQDAEVSSLKGILGGHFPDWKELVFAKMKVGMSNLHRWVGQSGIITKTRPGISHESILYLLPSIELCQFGSFRLGLEYSARLHSDFGENHISEDCVLAIEAQEMAPVEAFLEIARKFCQFLTLGVGRPSHVQSIFAHLDKPIKIVNGKPIYDEYELLLKHRPVETTPEKVTHHDMLFCLGDLHPKPANYVRSYYEKQDRLEPVSNLLFLTVYYPDMVLPQQLLVLANAVEAYHRAFIGGKYQLDSDYQVGLQKLLEEALPADLDSDFRTSLKNKLRYLNEYSLRKRVKDICEKFEPLLSGLLGSPKRFAEEIANLRNRLTHQDPTTNNQQSEIDWKDFFVKCEQLGLMLEVCLLHEIGFSFEGITNLLPRNRRVNAIRINR